jgi:hypothetical protein
MNFNWIRINHELSKHFGKGNVELRTDPRKEYPFVLWFLEDYPAQETIQKAKNIVEKYQHSTWFDNEMRITN